MSDLGAMCLFNLKRDNKPGLGCYFFDFIYENTQSQGASELMCGFDVLKQQLLSDDFKEVTGDKFFSKIVL